MDKIKELEKRVEKLEAELKEANTLLYRARIEASPVKVGDVVIYKGNEYLVTSVDPKWGDTVKPWLTGNPRKADGTFGKAVRNLYSNWTKP